MFGGSRNSWAGRAGLRARLVCVQLFLQITDDFGQVETRVWAERHFLKKRLLRMRLFPRENPHLRKNVMSAVASAATSSTLDVRLGCKNRTGA